MKPKRKSVLNTNNGSKLHQGLINHPGESRKEWILSAMKEAGQEPGKTAKFQLWQPESHPVILINNEMAHQKLEYIHYNPVAAGFVTKAEEWKYSSAIDYYGGKGLLDIIYLDTLIK